MRPEMMTIAWRYSLSYFCKFYVFKISLLKNHYMKEGDNAVRKSQIMNTEVSFSYCLFFMTPQKRDNWFNKISI